MFSKVKSDTMLGLTLLQNLKQETELAKAGLPNCPFPQSNPGYPSTIPQQTAQQLQAVRKGKEFVSDC